MIYAFAIASFALYIAAAIVLMGRFFHQQGPNKTLALGLGMAATMAHMAFLSQSIWVEPGQNMSITNVLSMVSVLIAVSMIISASLLPNVILLPAVFGFAAISVLAALLIPVSYIMHIELEPALLIHITLSLLAYGTLVVAFLYALQMSFIAYQLKHKGAAILHSSLPPLMLVEQILFRLILVGTLLLVVSQISGFIFLENMFSSKFAHKTGLSLGALVVYTVLLAGQKLWGWRSRQIVALAVSGVFLLTLAYFGSRLVREVIL